MRATRAVIHLDYLRDNIALVREKTGVSLCVPVKADAYGHGALRVAKTALEAGARCLAVATVAEGQELREGGISAPILLLSVAAPEEIPRIIDAGLEALAGDAEYIDTLAKAAQKARRGLALHLKVDTGMGRIGCGPEEAGALAARIADHGLFLAGTATHLAVSDSTAKRDTAFTALQLERFKTALDGIRARGMDPGIVHAANSGAVTFHKGAWFDMVRPGILLYGYAPPDGEGKPAMPVKPLMELESRVVFIKKVKKGESVSYGRIWTAPEDTFVGTIAAGYADGIPRQLSGKWNVYVDTPGHGAPRPLVGRICMDQCMVDLGPAPAASRWDRVVVFGGPAADAGALAARIGTIPYEICCNVNKRVPRVYAG
ncbi:MAG: alanine racemase [Treponema sp.]|jgi:alanine racemase|nr:alanine racemase [Treponema sp.]